MSIKWVTTKFSYDEHRGSREVRSQKDSTCHRPRWGAINLLAHKLGLSPRTSCCCKVWNELKPEGSKTIHKRCSVLSIYHLNICRDLEQVKQLQSSTFTSHSILPICLMSSLAGLSCLSVRLTQNFIPEGIRFCLDLVRLWSLKYPCTIITRHGS